MQLQLFEPQLEHSHSLRKILNQPTTSLAISNSGGKDSVAMLDFIVKQNYPCHIFSIHADLGLMEWTGTQEYIEQTCAERNVPLVTVRSTKSLFRHILERYKKRQGEVFWMSPKQRYCTSYMKTIPINKYLRRYQTIVNCVGIRAKESNNRALKSPIKLNKSLCSVKYLRLGIDKAIAQHLKKPLGRLAIDYYPLFHWDLEKVWQQLGHSTTEWEERRRESNDAKALKEWRFHYAYVLGRGNTRLSCCFCMMGNKNDLLNAIPHNPIAYRFITKLEQRSGFSFQSKRFLSKIVN